MDTRLGRLLRERQHLQGLTLDALAEKVGLTAGALSHIESGRRLPEPRNLARIAAALGLPEDEALDLLSQEHAERLRSSARRGSIPSEPEDPLEFSQPLYAAPPPSSYREMPIEALFDAS